MYLLSGKKSRDDEHWLVSKKIIVVAAIGLAAGLVGYKYAQPGYHRWKAQRAVQEARVYLQQGDLRDAQVALVVANRAGFSRDGYLALAEFFEASGSPQAIAARRTLLRAAPRDLSARLSLAATAMRFGDLPTAEEALAESTDGEKARPEYWKVASIMALETGRMPLANYFLDRLGALAPKDESIQLLRFGVLLHHPDRAKAAAARTDLERMAQTDQRLPALRLLLEDGFSHRDADRVRRFGLQIGAESKATLEDLLAAGSAEFFGRANASLDPALRIRIEGRASQNAFKAGEYAHWLLVRRQPDQAATWLDSLPPNLRTAPAVAAVRADAAAAQGDWDGLRDRLAENAWGSIPPTGLELAFAAHLLEARGQNELAGETWRTALEECRHSKDGMIALDRLALFWNWRVGEKEAVAATARAFPDDPRVYPEFVAFLREDRNTPALRDALASWRKLNPSSRELAYNWALVSLLEDAEHPAPEACREMEELLRSDPRNPFYAIGCAFSRVKTGRAREAIALLDAMAAAERQIPARAPYVAIAYAMAGEKGPALDAIGRAPSSTSLLPEESDLLERAKKLCSN